MVCNKINLEDSETLLISWPNNTYVIVDSGSTSALIPYEDYDLLLKAYDEVGVHCKA